VRFMRARNRCEWCGAENGKPHPVTGSKVVLTTAHVFDHRPEAASLLNLAALCQRCHNTHDAKMRSEGRKQRRVVTTAYRDARPRTSLATVRRPPA
jgi:5-methylcytosine-specific restriction endonuclease McrA